MLLLLFPKPPCLVFLRTSVAQEIKGQEATLEIGFGKEWEFRTLFDQDGPGVRGSIHLMWDNSNPGGTR